MQSRIESVDSKRQAIKIAAVDFIPAWGDLAGNVGRLEEAVKAVAEEGIDYAVFPETATTGYIFTDYAEISPFLDTIPGKTTHALLPLLKEHNLYMSVGIAEKDLDTGLAYNSAVLMGPEGIIGKYRKRGLNTQDQKLFAPGNCGDNVFETPIGKIGLLICYDDTYWQYARLTALKGAQIIGWHSFSDRIMPSASPSEKRGDHSTVSHVQHMSALNGVWVACSTRSGIETNPITKSQLYYNGGSSLWAPSGHKVSQAPVIPPVEIDPGLNGIYSATIDLNEADKTREMMLAKRRPDLYHPTLALHRVPDDANATITSKDVTLTAIQWDMKAANLADISVKENELVVLPEFSAIPASDHQGDILAAAEKQGGLFETTLCEITKRGNGYIVGSYPEIDEDMLYHTVVLAGPEGKIVGRYRATHLNERDSGWATPGHKMPVFETEIGRIALALHYELSVVEVGGVYAA